MQEALRKVRPTEFDDLVALVALYRPGAMDQIPTYARGKRDPESVQIPDPRLEPIIGGTYGVILYQEQAMLISKELAGFSGRPGRRPAQGDRQEEPRGDGQAQARVLRGLPRVRARAEQLIEHLWATNEKSADYSFNKSHAACYALVAYRTAWLKANYPAEYMAALISSVMDTKDKVPFFVAKTEDMGIEILPPDVNLSDHEFVVVEGNIRFGLDAVKGVGYQAVEAIKRAREEGGPFNSIWDFCCARRLPRGQQARDRGAHQVRRVRLDRRDAQGHARGARAGAGRRRRSSSRTPRSARARSSTWRSAATTRRGRPRPTAFGAPTHPPIPAEEFDKPELLAAEKESIGVFISAHPLKDVREAMRVKVDAPLAELRQTTRTATGSPPAASSPQCKKIRTKKGDPMMFATLDDLEGVVELDRSSATRSSSTAGALDVDEVVLVRGRVDHKDANKTCIVVQSVEPFQPTEAEVEKAKEELAKMQLGPEPLPIRVDAALLPRVVHRRSSRSCSRPSPASPTSSSTCRPQAGRAHAQARPVLPRRRHGLAARRARRSSSGPPRCPPAEPRRRRRPAPSTRGL